MTEKNILNQVLRQINLALESKLTAKQATVHFKQLKAFIEEERANKKDDGGSFL